MSEYYSEYMYTYKKLLIVFSRSLLQRFIEKGSKRFRTYVYIYSDW